ncbi:MAG TPA: Veg protein [Firmicutes bacterium]|nr:Veg protein [Bacillota bacterium]
MPSSQVLRAIRQNIDSHVGEKVRVRANKGRRKFIEKEGILEKTYPSIFVVKIEGKQIPIRRVSFSYTDVLTAAVELIICREEGEERIYASGI